jgi:hypothetical protein
MREMSYTSEFVRLMSSLLYTTQQVQILLYISKTNSRVNKNPQFSY